MYKNNYFSTCEKLNFSYAAALLSSTAALEAYSCHREKPHVEKIPLHRRRRTRRFSMKMTMPMAFRLAVDILPQPDETTCGPTCLHAIYRYWQEDEPLSEVIARTGKSSRAARWPYSWRATPCARATAPRSIPITSTVFDPTWFTDPTVEIAHAAGLATRGQERLPAAVCDRRLPGISLSLGGRLRTDTSVAPT